jgi:hypothetical protein
LITLDHSNSPRLGIVDLTLDNQWQSSAINCPKQNKQQQFIADAQTFLCTDFGASKAH